MQAITTAVVDVVVVVVVVEDGADLGWYADHPHQAHLLRC